MQYHSAVRENDSTGNYNDYDSMELLAVFYMGRERVTGDKAVIGGVSYYAKCS